MRIRFLPLFGLFVLAALLSSCNQTAHTASSSPAPAAAASPLPTPLALAPDAAPQILAVRLSDPVFHSGETITGTVITSTNVASVIVEVLGRTIGLPRVAFGNFALSQTMPDVPFFMRGNYTARVIARNAAGASAEQDISIAVR